MRFENTGLHNMTADLNHLDELLPTFGLTRDDHWDYERVTYDRKFELTEGVFYLRLQGKAIEGDVGAHKAQIQLLVPILGKYYYPHGVEYGEDEYFPVPLVQECEKVLSNVKKELDQFTGL